MNYIKEIKEFNEVLNKIYNDYQGGKLTKSEVDSISAALDDLEINQSYWSLFN